jgi:phage terminase small subunit
MGYENCGRRKTPALKILQGNPSKRKLPVELRPPVGEIVKPAGLSPGAAVVWDEIAPICLYMGTLTTADVPAFARMCEMEEQWNQVIALKGTKGFKLARMLQLARDLRPYSALFGLDPLSRSRIQVRQPDEASQAKWAVALK